uniref:Taste receptor type 2 n=1 Tax=Cyprinus carpio TaxID=7962 RepID=A0A2Z6FB59_CYPCA|nr:taste type 2 receptor 201 [Cyprinus carpio]
MLASSSATVVYLWKHIKRMEENGSSFSALRKKQQMKVTILGIIQGVLFFFASGWLMTEELFTYFTGFMDQHGHLICTVMALYSLGTTILLGVDPWMYNLLVAGLLFAMWTGFTASLALNVCYYFQIVPVRRPFLIWMKKHIRLFVYLALFVDRLFFLTEFLVRVIWEVSAMNLNSTIHVNITSETTDLEIYILAHVDFWIRCCYFLLCLGIMLASSSATVVYLWKHIKRMEENGSSFSALRKKQQMKVTILGIIQGVLFFLGSGWLMTEDLLSYFAVVFDRRGHLIRTVMALYSLGATILLGVGQSKFRLMAKNIGRKLQTWKFPLS